MAKSSVVQSWYKQLEESYWTNSAGSLVRNGLLNYTTQAFVFDPVTITSQGATKLSTLSNANLYSYLKTFTGTGANRSGNVSIANASHFLLTSWASNGWNTFSLDSLIFDIALFCANNFPSQSVNPLNADMNIEYVFGTVSGSQYFLPLIFFGDQRNAKGRAVFTQSGTFVVPSGVSSVDLIGSGGGGGGCGGSTGSGNNSCGGGGSGPKLAPGTVVTAGSSIAVTIGQGGPGGGPGNVGGGATGTNGTATTFGGLYTCNGGGRGDWHTTGGVGIGADGGGNGGDALHATFANNGSPSSTAIWGMGLGGTAFSDGGGGGGFGNGGNSANGATAAGAAGFGGGGGGGDYPNGLAGGNGGNGILIISWNS